MGTTQLLRTYSCNDGELSRLAKGIKRNVQSDITDFAVRNIDAAHIAKFAAMINDFDDTPTDIEF